MYCCQSGWSKPNCAISSAWRSGETARSPAMSSTGSPGSMRMKTNATRVMPMNVGTIMSRRCRMKRSIASPAGGGAGADLGARPLSCRYSALLTPRKRWMPSGSCT